MGEMTLRQVQALDAQGVVTQTWQAGDPVAGHTWRRTTPFSVGPKVEFEPFADSDDTWLFLPGPPSECVR